MTDYKGARWAVVWRSKNKLDGKREHFMFDGEGNVCIYKTRKQAREVMEMQWGYIKTRPDLQREPFGWKAPTVRRVTVTVKEQSK